MKREWFEVTEKVMAQNLEIIPVEGLPPGSAIVMAGPLIGRRGESLSDLVDRSVREGRIFAMKNFGEPPHPAGC